MTSIDFQEVKTQLALAAIRHVYAGRSLTPLFRIQPFPAS